MRVVGTKTGGYAIFGSDTSGGADYECTVYSTVEDIGTITDRVSYSAAKDCKALTTNFGYGTLLGGKNTPVRFVASKPSWWSDTSTWRYAKQLVWNEMENGALVLKVPISSGNRYKTIHNKYYNNYQVPSDSVSIGGATYTVNVMDLGHLSSAGDTSLTDNNEFVKYIYSSRNSASQGGIAPGWGSFGSGGLVSLAQDGKYNGAYGVPYYKSATSSSPSGTYVMHDGYINGAYYMSILFVAHPAAYKPYIEGLSADQGAHSRGFNIVSKIEYDGSGTVDWQVSEGGEVIATGNDVSPDLPISLTDEQVTGLGLGSHTLTVEVSSGGGSNTYTTSVTVISNTIDAQGDPVSSDRRPAACSLMNIVQLGTGATEKWYVTNNANDSAPVWEEYSSGVHEFSNDSKTSSQWAVSWRCQIGGASATSQSKLTQKVGMAVVYDEND